MEKKNIAFKTGILLIIVIALYYMFSLWQHQHTPLILYGNVDIRDVNLGFRVSGRLMEFKVDEGDDVHKGDLMARLDLIYPHEIEVGFVGVADSPKTLKKQAVM